MSAKAAGARASVGQPGGRKENRDIVEQRVRYVVGYVGCLQDARQCDDPQIREEICEMLRDMVFLGTDAIGIAWPRFHMSETAAYDNAAALDLFRAIQAFLEPWEYVHSEYAGEVMWFSHVEPSDSCSVKRIAASPLSRASVSKLWLQFHYPLCQREQ